MNFGQMKQWTQRFNQILNGLSRLKQQRLNAMLNDLVLAHEPTDGHARCMYLAVLEEMEV